MQELGNFVIDYSVKCWTCPVFDHLFTIISNAAAATYKRLTLFAVVIFCILFAFYVFSAFWKNMEGGMKDSFYQSSVKPVLIKSILALSLLTLGLTVPRFISKITFEPVATITLKFSEIMLPKDYPIVRDYQKIEMKDDGFFTPQLRDTILDTIQTSISNFQVYIKLGLDILDAGFSINMLFGIGALIRHIIVCFIGILLTYNFIKLFIKYSFCFMDIIVAMAMFAFFFPLSLVFFIFKDAQHLPAWMKNLGGNLGGGQIKKLINAIVSVASSILTYTIIMLIIKGYLGGHAESFNGSFDEIFDFDLEESSFMQIKFAGAIVLVYVIKYISDQIPQITKKILSVFGLSQEDSLSKEAGENAFAITTAVTDNMKKLATAIVNPDSANKDVNNKEEKKEDKK